MPVPVPMGRPCVHPNSPAARALTHGVCVCWGVDDGFPDLDLPRAHVTPLQAPGTWPGVTVALLAFPTALSRGWSLNRPDLELPKDLQVC